MKAKVNGIVPRPEIAAVPPAHHGALDYAELERLGYAPEDVRDFSVNTNAYGPPPGVREALHAVPLDRYPDRECLALRRALAAQLDVGTESIVIGNGAAELLWLIACTYLRPNDRVLILAPTFGEYARVSALAGASIDEIRSNPGDRFGFDPDSVARRIAENGPCAVFCCTPNNPTGIPLPPGAIEMWAAQNPGTLFVVDEAYIQFAEGLKSAAALRVPNVLVVRSMTKDYALAGLRLGYAVGHPEIIGTVAQLRPPWNVNAMAQAAGLAALEDDDHLNRTIAALRAAKAELIAELRVLGLEPLPSSTSYFLVNVGDGAAFRRKVFRHAAIVRDCASFGLPAHVRIGTKQPEDNAHLIRAIREAT